VKTSTLLHGLIESVGAVLFDTVMPKGTIGDDQARSQCEPTERLYQGGAHLVLRREFLLGGESAA
jgi:hypothetical protein